MPPKQWIGVDHNRCITGRAKPESVARTATLLHTIVAWQLADQDHPLTGTLHEPNIWKQVVGTAESLEYSVNYYYYYSFLSSIVKKLFGFLIGRRSNLFQFSIIQSIIYSTWTQELFGFICFPFSPLQGLINWLIWINNVCQLSWANVIANDVSGLSHLTTTHPISFQKGSYIRAGLKMGVWYVPFQLWNGNLVAKPAVCN